MLIQGRPYFSSKNVCVYLFYSRLRFYWHLSELKQERANKRVSWCQSQAPKAVGWVDSELGFLGQWAGVVCPRRAAFSSSLPVCGTGDTSLGC